MNALFICSQNKLRSPTAEAVFAEYPGVETASAGLNRGADVPVGGELLKWADLAQLDEVSTEAVRAIKRRGALIVMINEALDGMEKGRAEIRVGKVKLLTLMQRLAPSVAARILRNA